MSEGTDRPIEVVGAPAVATLDRREASSGAQSARWSPLSASVLGSVHVRDRLPLQDSVLTWADGDQSVIAVADGHGHRAHFRSDTGSALAVVTAVEELRRVLGDLTDAETAADVARGAFASLVSSWGAKVRHHAAAQPFSDTELELGAGDDVLLPYGTTVVTIAVSGDVLVVAQIGDGDTVLVDGNGEAFRPLPDDPFQDGVRTHSLCQPDPMSALRLAVFDTRVEDVALAFACTDGFGNSRVESDWWQQTGHQLWQYAEQNGVDWIRDQLAGWLEEPARIGGDDTTMAIIVRS